VSTIALLLGTVTIPFLGLLADRIGRRPVFAGGLVIGGILLFPFFLAAGTGTRVEDNVTTFTWTKPVTSPRDHELPWQQP
jgi:MFS family permease